MIDTSNLYYYGNSDGAILGGILTAVAPDFRRAVLGVGGMDFFNLLVPRGHGFSHFGNIALSNFPDQSLHPLILDLLQQLWDRADPDGYAQQMTTETLPDTPSHVVLMQVAYGDFEVSVYAAAVQARTIGASAYEPALGLEAGRARDAKLFFGLPAIRAFRSRARRSRSGTAVRASPNRRRLRTCRPCQAPPTAIRTRVRATPRPRSCRSRTS